MFLIRDPVGAVYMVDASGKRHIQRPEYIHLAAAAGSEAALKVQPVTAAEAAQIPDVPGPVAPLPLDPHVAADIATIAALARKLGLP